YVDSNLFVFPELYRGRKATYARYGLALLALGHFQGYTCILTIDEVCWKIWQERGVEEAVKVSRGILRFPNLAIVPLTREDALRAIGYVKRFGLRPRDSIHLSAMKEIGVGEIVSDDADFDRVGWAKRYEFGAFVATFPADAVKEAKRVWGSA
ncbi:TPA: PIN domain-containing protein, partial [Candidatus Bathyarchaeota archaeon]|nr:PIN domain-containing protein [Candidatus Bathyarchaeota archaeon]